MPFFQGFCTDASRTRASGDGRATPFRAQNTAQPAIAAVEALLPRSFPARLRPPRRQPIASASAITACEATRSIRRSLRTPRVDRSGRSSTTSAPPAVAPAPIRCLTRQAPRSALRRAPRATGGRGAGHARAARGVRVPPHAHARVRRHCDAARNVRERPPERCARGRVCRRSLAGRSPRSRGTGLSRRGRPRGDGAPDPRPHRRGRWGWRFGRRLGAEILSWNPAEDAAISDGGSGAEGEALQRAPPSSRDQPRAAGVVGPLVHPPAGTAATRTVTGLCSPATGPGHPDAVRRSPKDSGRC